MSQNQLRTDTLDRVRQQHHPRCFVGRAERSFGLGVRYTIHPDGHVEATISCPPSWEGYPGLVHGGIIAALLDGAMTNSLFARGIVSFTAELRVRYRHPLPLGQSVTILGEVTRCSRPPFVTEARIVQGGRIHATCTGKFMPVPDRGPREGIDE